METSTTAPRKFAALRNRDARPYMIGAGLAMMADNIEHVITYWVLWETFHSPFLAGFQVISHWLPFLFLSVHFGALADRYDCRRVVQAAQGLFMLASVGWAVLFLTDTLQIWHACVLLVLHGCAGALWGPGEQLMLHDFVGNEDLPSAVRLNATFRSIGVLFGPVIGSALLLGLGPTAGIAVNVLFYLPLTLFLFRTRFTGHTRHGGPNPTRLGVLGALRVLRDVAGDRVLMTMIVLAGLGSFFVGASMQSAMPEFAGDYGSGAAYGVLLLANGAGGVVGGLLLEVFDRIRPTVRAAIVSTVLYGLSTVAFALTRNIWLAVLLLLVGGTAAMASMTISQTVVQLRAEPSQRGRVLGVYGMSAGGLRFGSGFTVGLLGAAVGLRQSLALSAVALCVGTVAAGLWARGRTREH
ncbi:MFS transporter [Virgisporangium aliadipatigenens]|uniref:MFS transporter n=1 Tax=Virgisporangium aliadipatigenens TaxID=741659 RepID=A0A8J4DRY9_9ACTN|nr:MFS transporter [Virgisporangium aliadipatigenens]GIJ48174.1 MFS transporter [Virgisporangium aliadipatigenens]